MSMGQGVVSMEQVSHVQISWFIMDCSRQTAITADSGRLALNIYEIAIGIYYFI